MRGLSSGRGGATRCTGTPPGAIRGPGGLAGRRFTNGADAAPMTAAEMCAAMFAAATKAEKLAGRGAASDCPALAPLNVGRNQIGDAGLVALAEAGPPPTLTKLWLGGNLNLNPSV